MYIPDDLRWFPVLPGTGNETFYLLASIKRLTTLENLIKDFREKKKEDPRNEQTMDAHQAVHGEIRTLMIDHFPLARDIKKDNRIVAVTFRGDVHYSFPAEKVIVDDFFIKTVTLSH